MKHAAWVSWVSGLIAGALACSFGRSPSGMGSWVAAEPTAGWNTEQYDPIPESGYRLASEQPLSTFSVDVDTASYSNVRRFLQAGQRPPIDAVRIEELVNYFDYDTPGAEPGRTIAIATELADSPFGAGRKLARISLRASASQSERPPARNLVFLIDVSGSMQDESKLPLLKSALALLVERLDAADSVAIAVYAGSSGVALEPTRGDQHAQIVKAIDELEAGGSTHGSEGIELAYQLALQQHRPGAINRVILATDGDFNVGITDRGSLVRLIERKRAQGVFLTVLGFGMGNLKDATMEQLADRGDGSYAYIDTLREARKVLVEQAGATLRTVAKNAKIQVEFNPARVSRYRLIGYENRRLNDEDFNDDGKDAGDMGDGHTVTALYELELTGTEPRATPQLDPLKYQAARAPSSASSSSELLTVKVRYSSPEGGPSELVSTVLHAEPSAFERASADLRFAAAVAGFGMLLRQSPHAGRLEFGDVERIAAAALGRDAHGYRREFIELVARAREVSNN